MFNFRGNMQDDDIFMTQPKVENEYGHFGALKFHSMFSELLFINKNQLTNSHVFENFTTDRYAAPNF